MFQKKKRKRSPHPYRAPVLTVSALIVGVVLLFTALLRRPSTDSFSLASFDVNESQDQIALSWSNGSTNLMATRRWSDVKAGTPTITNVMSGLAVPIESLSYQPNGSGLVSITSQHIGQLYLANVLQPHIPYSIKFMKYSPDGQWLLIYTPEKEVTLFQTTRINQNYDLRQPDKQISLDGKFILDIAISADNTLVAVVGTDTEKHMVIQVFRVWDQSMVYELSLPYASPQAVLAFHPNSKQLAVVFDQTIHQIDFETGQDKAERVLMGKVQQVGYDPTGRWLVVGSGYSQPDTEGLQSAVYIYDLTLSHDVPFAVYPGDKVVKFQFLKDSLVIGHDFNQLDIWQWINEAEGWDHTGVAFVAWEN